MVLVEFVLDLPSPGGLVHGHPHGWGHRIGVHNDLAVGVSGRPAHGLDQAGLTAQEAFLVRVQDGHQAHLRQVQALPQQIDAHQHIEFGKAQVPDDLHPLHGPDVGVHIPDFDTGLLQIHRQVLRHLLGQGGDQHPLLPGGAQVDLPDEVIDLAVDGPDLYLGIQQARRPDHLLHGLAGPGPLVLPRSGGDVDDLVDLLVELPEVQGPVVIGRRQPEAVVHQGILPAPVPGIHGPALGQGHMALVNEHEIIFREVVQQGGRGRSRSPALNDPGVILNAVAEADLRHHLQVVGRPLGNALGLDELALPPEFLHLAVAFLLNFQHGPLELLFGGHIVAGGIDGHMIHIPFRQAGHGVDLADPVDLVSEELHTDGPAGPVGRVDLQGIPPDPELVPGKVQVVSLVADLRQLFENLVHRPLHAHPEGDDHALIIDGIPQAVETADGGHNDHVPPLEEGRGSRVPQPVDLLIDGGILFDIGVRVGDIGLGLIIVVIGDKILHHVVGKKFPELRAQLGRQCLIMGQDQSWPVEPGDHGSHGKGLAGSGDPQQGLLPQSPVDAVGQGLNGLRLVAGGLVFGNQFKMIHKFSFCSWGIATPVRALVRNDSMIISAGTG